MKLELKNLAGYLPYGLNVIDEEIGEQFEVAGFNIANNEFLIHDNIDGGIEEYSIDLLKPILRPLSDLTKEIEVNGEKFVPGDTDLLGKYEISVIPVFDFFDGTGSNQNIDDLPYCVIQKLLKWHFDIYGLIENGLAIDLNTLES